MRKTVAGTLRVPSARAWVPCLLDERSESASMWAASSCPRQAWAWRPTRLPPAIALVMLLVTIGALAADPNAEEQAAIQAAVAHAAPAVVQIETVGGLEQVKGVLVGTAPTTGLIVEPSGYVVSSAFNFVNKPSSILVRLPGGTRKSAKLVATDHSRMLVLLKIEAADPLPVCETAPRGTMHVGQWAIAVGRAFDADRPNIAVGILSALNRVWGKAIQTDAAISPNNYGGPLLDIRGRVLGILVPLSPNDAGEMGGLEWYDSGIGFAVPMEHVRSVLPRLMKGEDLYPGIAGFTLKSQNSLTGEAVIGECKAKGPADVAGLKKGDRVVEIDGRTIRRAADLREALGLAYAGDELRVTVLRGEERVKVSLKLAKQ
jgi:serine protease Do